MEKTIDKKELDVLIEKLTSRGYEQIKDCPEYKQFSRPDKDGYYFVTSSGMLKFGQTIENSIYRSGPRGPRGKYSFPKTAFSYTRIDFENPASPEETAALAKLQAMKPSERTKYITALWAEDQVRFLGGVSE